MATPTDRDSHAYWTDVARIFSSVVDRGDQADAALDTLCAGRPDLRAEVEWLLAAQDRASGFLATTTHDPFAEDAHALSALTSAPEFDRDPAARRGQRMARSRSASSSQPAAWAASTAPIGPTATSRSTSPSR
jgi:hypothetical protein